MHARIFLAVHHHGVLAQDTAYSMLAKKTKKNVQYNKRV